MGRVIFLTNFKSVDDLIKALDPPAAVDALAGRAGAHLAPLGLGLVAVRLHLWLRAKDHAYGAEVWPYGARWTSMLRIGPTRV